MYFEMNFGISVFVMIMPHSGLNLWLML